MRARKELERLKKEKEERESERKRKEKEERERREREERERKEREEQERIEELKRIGKFNAELEEKKRLERLQKEKEEKEERERLEREAEELEERLKKEKEEKYRQAKEERERKEREERETKIEKEKEKAAPGKVSARSQYHHPPSKTPRAGRDIFDAEDNPFETLESISDKHIAKIVDNSSLSLLKTPRLLQGLGKQVQKTPRDVRERLGPLPIPTSNSDRLKLKLGGSILCIFVNSSSHSPPLFPFSFSLLPSRHRLSSGNLLLLLLLLLSCSPLHRRSRGSLHQLAERQDPREALHREGVQFCGRVQQQRGGDAGRGVGDTGVDGRLFAPDFYVGISRGRAEIFLCKDGEAKRLQLDRSDEFVQVRQRDVLLLLSHGRDLWHKDGDLSRTVSLTESDRERKAELCVTRMSFSLT